MQAISTRDCGQPFKLPNALHWALKLLKDDAHSAALSVGIFVTVAFGVVQDDARAAGGPGEDEQE